MGISSAVLLLTAMASACGWLWIAQRQGKFFAWIGYNVVACCTCLLFLSVREGDAYAMIAVMALSGIPYGGHFLNHSLLADVIDYDEVRVTWQMNTNARVLKHHPDNITYPDVITLT
jgi:Na+/melibiose symporter-like transporter